MWTGRVPVKKASVTAVAFAPDGRTIYTGDTSGHVIAWDADTHESRVLFARPADAARVGIYRLWPLADGSRLIFRDNSRLVDAFRPDADPVLSSAGLVGDWRYLLPDGKRAIKCESEWRVGLWDITTGARVPVPGPLGKATNITYHRLLPDGVTFLTYLSRTDELILWNFDTGERIGELTPGGSGVHPCELSPDGTVFAVGRISKIWVYDVATRALRHRLKYGKEIRALAFHPTNRLLASTSTDSGVTFWDTVAGTQVRQFDWQIGKAEAVCFAPDGLTCVVAGTNGRFAVFDVDV